MNAKEYNKAKEREALTYIDDYVTKHRDTILNMEILASHKKLAYSEIENQINKIRNNIETMRTIEKVYTNLDNKSVDYTLIRMNDANIMVPISLAKDMLLSTLRQLQQENEITMRIHKHGEKREENYGE